MKLFLAATCAALMIGSAASAATIVQNGSFENGAVSLNGDGWGTTGSGGLPGWTTGRHGIEIQTNPTLGFINAQDGARYVELDTRRNSYMEQGITLASTGSYLLEFWYAPRVQNAATNGITYSIAGVTGTVTSPISNAVNGWMKVVVSFVATSTNQTLRFDAAGTSDSIGGLVDNVSIAAVPVPAAGFMLFGALGGLFALRRRKAAIAA